MNTASNKILICLAIGLIVVLSRISAQQVNPFELYSYQDTISVIDSIQEDSLPTSISEIVPEIVTEEKEEVEEGEKVVMNVNPFELVEVEEQSFLEEEATDTSSIIVNKVSEDVSEKPETAIISPLKEFIALPEAGKNLYVFWISLISGLLLAISFNSNRSILSEIGKSLQNLNFMKLLQKDEKNGWSTAYVILLAIFILNISIFIRLLCIHYEVAFLRYNYIYILLFIIFLTFIRHFGLYVISYLRKRLSDVINYSFIIITINIILGLLLVPINLIIAFGPTEIAGKTILIGLVIIGLATIMKWFRGFLNSIRIIIGDSFHFLLYLCTCEIVPILIFIGYLRNLIN